MAPTILASPAAPPWIALACLALAAQGDSLRRALICAYEYAGLPVPQDLVPQRPRHLHAV